VNYSHISVLITALNEEEGIGQTLLKLKKLDKPLPSGQADGEATGSKVFLHLDFQLEEDF
jgi:hypothetical protein